MSKHKIYLDYAATTPLDGAVLTKMLPYLKDKYGNPSSVHRFGQEAQTAIENARDQVAKFLNCKPSEIVFTGSASESDNLAIRGLIPSSASGQVHIITTKIEHKAVLETCKDLETEKVKAIYLPVGLDGIINLNDLEAKITPETDLISIMYVNNEMGAIQPIEEIGKLIAKINKNKEHKIYFHTDAAQAINWLSCDVQKLGVDLLTLSGHKIYGPKGVGVLYIREGTPIKPIITGGSHEWGLRAGTENVAGIVGLGQAIENIKTFQASNIKHLKHLRSKLIKGVLKISGSKLNGPASAKASAGESAPHIANFSFLGVEGESLVISLNEEGIAVSTGSACTSTALMPSHVLMAMGLSELESHSSLRVGLGKQTTEQEINYFLKVLPNVINRLRKISGR